MAVLKAGKTYVPLDPAYPRARNTYILKNTRARVLVTNSKNLSLAKELAQDVISLVNVDEFDPSISGENLSLPVSPDAVAYILHTSGSTGQPKGVPQSHRNVLHEIMNYTNAVHICRDDRMLLISALSFGDAVRTTYGALLNGASLYPLDIKEEGLAPLADWLIQQEVTIYRSVATAFRYFASNLTGEEKFPKLRLIYLAGEPVYKRHVDLYKKYFPPDCIFVNGLGSSECLTFRWYFVGKETPIDGSNVPVGYAIEDMETLLINDAGEDVGIGEIGEIAVKSRYLSPGYWRRPDLTQEKFLPDPGGGDGRIYLTGDLGRMLPDGCLVHMGRKDFQVKIRGYRIETAEIEMQLVSLDNIRETAVVAREDQAGDQSLVAYLVPTGQDKPNVAELRRFLAQSLPDYMIPAAFVMIDTLPLSPNGKVDRRALPAPDRSRPEQETAFIAARSREEEALAGILARVLGLEQVGIHDNFFELGGNSLLAATFFLEIEKKLGKRLPLEALLRAPTVAQLADILRRSAPAGSASWSSLVEIQFGGSKLPFFCVHTLDGDVVSYLELASHLDAERPFYGLRAQGCDGKKAPCARFEEMATQYVKELRSVQPEGPYLLGGMCLGGMVAFEMAQQLQAQSQEVGLLALMDTGRPPYSTRQFLRLRADRFYRRARAAIFDFVKRPVRHFRRLSRLNPLHWPAYLRDKAKVAKEVTIDRSSPRAERLRTSRLMEAYRAKVDAANQRAMQNYKPQPYRGRITLFLVSQPRIRSFPDPRMGWAELASDGVELHVIPGDHHAMLKEPTVRILAAKLDACLRRAAPTSPK